MPSGINEYEYYKTISPLEIHVGKKHSFSYIKYDDENDKEKPIQYIFKCGQITLEELKKKIVEIPKSISWDVEKNYKVTTAEKEKVEKVLSKNIICFFGPDRYEKPMWMGKQYYDEKNYESITVKEKYAGKWNRQYR